MYYGRFQNFQVDRIFLEAENLTPSTQLPIQKAKQRRWGNFSQKPRQLQRDEKHKVRRADSKPFLVQSVCNCGDFVWWRGRRTACRASPGQCLGYFVPGEPSLHLFPCLVGRAFELGCLAFENPFPFSAQSPAVLFPFLCSVQCGVWACV